MTNETALEKARALAEEAHCRYCTREVSKCKADIESDTRLIAAALKRAYTDGMASAYGYESEQSQRIRAEADKLEGK